MKKQILITGSEGRIGQQLMNGLPKDQYDIIGFDIINGQDATDYRQLRDAAMGSFAVIHTAFNLKDEYSKTGYEGDPGNFAMGRFALKAAVEAKAEHCIMASSVNAARNSDDKNWSYRETKLDLERLAAQYAKDFPRTTFTSIRYGRIDGEDTPPMGPLRANQSWISAKDHLALVGAILGSGSHDEHTIVYGVSNRYDQPYDPGNRFGFIPQSWFGLEAEDVQ